ncbi:MAG: 8-oxo-dGTP diphosphatase MutT [Aeromonadaceae bacterium]
MVAQGKKRLWVAVGVIENDRGQIFICQRASRQHQAGKWEFPGGKVEEGESLQQALRRELFEEIGIEVEACEPLLKIEHDYPDKAVLLDVWRVTAFSGKPYGKEGQPGLWVAREELANYDFPDANQPITQRVMQG